MIKRIKETLNKILNEDYWYDKHIRDVALELWKEVRLDFLYNKNYLNDIIFDSPVMYKSYEDKLGNNIDIGFMPKYLQGNQISTSLGFFTRENNRIVIVVPNDRNDSSYLPNRPSALEVYREIKTEIGRLGGEYSETFVHEYVHFINEMRYKDPELDKKYKRAGAVYKGKEVSYQDYMKQGIELTAFIQGMLHEIDYGLTTKLYVNRLQIFSSFDNFREFVNKASRSFSRLSLLVNEKEYDKVLKKLYNYFEKKKEEVGLAIKNEYIFIREVKKALKGYPSDNFKLGIKAYGGARKAVFHYARSNGADYYLIGELTTPGEKLYNKDRDDLLKKVLIETYPDLTNDIEKSYD